MNIKYKLFHNELVDFVSKFIPDKAYLKMKYRLLTGDALHLNNPRTFNEKIQWLKLYDHNPQYCILADKCDAKKVISKWIGEQHIIPTIACWDRIEDIDFSVLPEQFVLKTTHDSGGVVICKNKSSFDVTGALQKLKKSYRRNYYWHGREWSYKDLRPRIIAEPYLVDESGYELKDYKVFVFSGKAVYIQVDFDRFTNHQRNFYSTEWKYVPFTTMYPTNPDKVIQKPDALNELLTLAEIIANNISNPPFVRVDFYVISNKVFFGEVTFHHGSGTEKFEPESYNMILGDMIIIDSSEKGYLYSRKIL